MALVVMATCTGAGGGSDGVFCLLQRKQGANFCRSQEVGGMTEGKESRERMEGKMKGWKVVSCKTLAWSPLLSPWVCSWMKKAVKYVFHSSLILCHNKRIKEYCFRSVRCSRNGSLDSDDLRYRSVVFFYSPFNILTASARWETGGGRRGGSWAAGPRVTAGDSPLKASPLQPG